jgi:hypothetical protein
MNNGVIEELAQIIKLTLAVNTVLYCINITQRLILCSVQCDMILCEFAVRVCLLPRVEKLLTKRRLDPV